MKWEEIQEKADLAYNHLQKAYELLDEIDNEEIEDAPFPDCIEQVEVYTATRRIVQAMNEIEGYTT